MFRYISAETERYWPDESKALQSCLQEAILWFPLQPPNPEEIPQDNTLRHLLHSMVKYLEEVEKVRFACIIILATDLILILTREEIMCICRPCQFTSRNHLECNNLGQKSWNAKRSSVQYQ